MFTALASFSCIAYGQEKAHPQEVVLKRPASLKMIANALAKKHNLTENDFFNLTSNIRRDNLHITNWNNVPAGTKIMYITGQQNLQEKTTFKEEDRRTDVRPKMEEPRKNGSAKNIFYLSYGFTRYTTSDAIQQTSNIDASHNAHHLALTWARLQGRIINLWFSGDYGVSSTVERDGRKIELDPSYSLAAAATFKNVSKVLFPLIAVEIQRITFLSLNKNLDLTQQNVTNILSSTSGRFLWAEAGVMAPAKFFNNNLSVLTLILGRSLMGKTMLSDNSYAESPTALKIKLSYQQFFYRNWFIELPYQYIQINGKHDTTQAMMGLYLGKRF